MIISYWAPSSSQFSITTFRSRVRAVLLLK